MTIRQNPDSTECTLTRREVMEARDADVRGPILVTCEGSRAPTVGMGICPMCGKGWLLSEGAATPEHKRDNIIARIDRGDFDR